MASGLEIGGSDDGQQYLAKVVTAMLKSPVGQPD
jgi:hypothetical protein